MIGFTSTAISLHCNYRKSECLQGPQEGSKRLWRLWLLRPVSMYESLLYLNDAGFGPAFIDICAEAALTSKVYRNDTNGSKDR